MNNFERYIYNLVRDYPPLKLFLRNRYQDLFDVFNFKSSVSSEYHIKSRPGYFFGFHDHTPFSSDDSKLLACKDIYGPQYMPSEKDKLPIGFFDGPDLGNFNHVSSSNAWLWHMGCKLQWVGNSNSLIFNDYLDNSYVSRLINLDDSSETIFDGNISSVSLDGKWAVGYSFSHVYKCMPGYGYIHVDRDTLDTSLSPSNHGISIINSPCTIDSGYRGEINIPIINHGNETCEIKRGERIAQAVFKKVEIAELEEVEELEETSRGSNGFGSTGRFN